MNDLFLIALNLTRRCNLACAHCYMDAKDRSHGTEGELSGDEVKSLLDQIADRNDQTMVVLTGGEPLLRRDLELLVRHGSRAGLFIVVGTNGVLLNEKRIISLKQAGTMGVGISLDSLEPQRHDNFRGCPGAWRKTLDAMDHCRKHELAFQLHFSVTEDNAHEIPSLIEFASAVGAHVLNIFFLVCTGRGESMSDISPQRYEQVLQQLLDAQAQYTDVLIRARCAPHFKRLAYQRDPESALTRAQGYEGGGCLAGKHYCRITPEGAVTACPYIEQSAGNIRASGFWTIWDSSRSFEQLRRPSLQGKCGVCEFQQLCGGCRARPLALGRSIMDTDPWCAYEPLGQAIIQPLQENHTQQIQWTPEAEQRLARVPGFLRKMVRKRAEDYVRELGIAAVRPAHMAALAAERFANGFPGHRPQRSEQPADVQTALAWTQAAQNYLESLPSFLQAGIRTVAEEVAIEEGRLEVNIKLIRRLEGDGTAGRKLKWEESADRVLNDHLEQNKPHLAFLIKPSIEIAAERLAKRRKSTIVQQADIQSVLKTSLAGVEWEPDALSRVESAPEFVRAGIKKAAEFGAGREGLTRITSEDLTRFRNRAMMKAVKRIKSFGQKELEFDVFSIAQQKVPRLKENQQAVNRFNRIKQYVQDRQRPDGSGLGLLDRDMLDKMKAELKK